MPLPRVYSRAVSDTNVYESKIPAAGGAATVVRLAKRTNALPLQALGCEHTPGAWPEGLPHVSSPGASAPRAEKGPASREEVPEEERREALDKGFRRRLETPRRNSLLWPASLEKAQL